MPKLIVPALFASDLQGRNILNFLDEFYAKCNHVSTNIVVAKKRLICIIKLAVAGALICPPLPQLSSVAGISVLPATAEALQVAGSRSPLMPY